MRILGIVPYCFLPPKIGGQKAIEQLYRSLGKKVSVSVISTSNNDTNDAKEFALIPLFNNHILRYGNFFYLKKTGDYIQQTGITHLFMEHPYMGWMGIYLKKKHNILLVIHSHNIESIRFKSIGKKWWKLLWYYERYIYNSADFVFFMTDADRDYAVEHYHLPSQKAVTAGYGTEVKSAPSLEERKEAKGKICDVLQLNRDEALLLFNGSFDYAPNANALQVLVEQIVPLLNKKSFDYKLIVCGRNISNSIKNLQPKNVIFLDYVNDIFIYNLAADVFVNPVIEGGGIKTKLVEALAAGANAVSVRSGALGVDPSWCNGKLYISEDGDWQAFTDSIIKAAMNTNEMTAVFYQHFFIDNIAENILKIISKT